MDPVATQDPTAEGQTAGLAVTEAPAPSTEQTAQTAEAAPTEQAQPEGQPAPAPTANPEEGSTRRDTNAERRIGSLTARAKAAEETVSSLNAEKAALQEQLNDLKAPLEDDFDRDSEHMAATVRHATTEANIQGRLDANAREAGRVQQAQQQALVNEVVEKVEAFSAKTPDYGQSVQKIANLQNLAGSVMQLSNTPEVFYALSKDLNLAAALEQMPENQRLIELGRISAEVTVKPVTVSNAPPPVQSAVGGTAVAASGLRDDMTMAEFDVWHNEHFGPSA